MLAFEETREEGREALRAEEAMRLTAILSAIRTAHDHTGRVLAGTPLDRAIDL